MRTNPIRRWSVADPLHFHGDSFRGKSGARFASKCAVKPYIPCNVDCMSEVIRTSIFSGRYLDVLRILSQMEVDADVIRMSLRRYAEVILTLYFL